MLKLVYEALLAQGVCPEQCPLGVQVTSVFNLCQGKVRTLSILALVPGDALPVIASGVSPRGVQSVKYL